MLLGMWDLSSTTRDWNCVPCSGSTVLTTGPPGKPKDMSNFVAITNTAEYTKSAEYLCVDILSILSIWENLQVESKHPDIAFIKNFTHWPEYLSSFLNLCNIGYHLVNTFITKVYFFIVSICIPLIIWEGENFIWVY